MRWILYGTLGVALIASAQDGHIQTNEFCMGAMYAIVVEAAAQETTLPKDEWCQRPPVRDNKAHACACHQHDCSDPDPDHVSAHVDAQCLAYCRVSACKCVSQDCP